MNVYLRDFASRRFVENYALKSFAVGGLISAIFQLNNIIYPEYKGFQGTPVLILVIVISAIVGLILNWPREINECFDAPSTRVRIIEGDLLAQDQHLVIGACDTFDTAIPNIISTRSLQGQALSQLFGGDVVELDKHLQIALQNKAIVGSIQKDGKNNKYGVGTVATINHGARKLFFLAYTQMNQRNEAHASIDDIWLSLQELWKEVSVHANGQAICISAIGGGHARLSSVFPAQDAIRFIVLSFIIASRHSKICDELRIVIRKQEYERLDRLELQSFLKSLRRS